MVRLGHADVRIGTLADLTRHHEGEDAREIGLIGKRQEVEHETDVLLERLRHADRFRRHVGTTPAAFQRADR